MNAILMISAKMATPELLEITVYCTQRRVCVCVCVCV